MPVSVDTSKFVNTWGHGPRGYGHWLFLIGGKEYSFSGSYSEAKAKAVKVGNKAPRVTRIYVLP